jgi:hypothetical protein
MLLLAWILFNLLIIAAAGPADPVPPVALYGVETTKGRYVDGTAELSFQFSQDASIRGTTFKQRVADCSVANFPHEKQLQLS